jgi:transcriptional regulator with PAS, ATPase and Fis domain
MGRVPAAHAGTLFLDEISELPLGMQAKLLRFLQNGEIQRLGCTDVFRVDVRVVASSNCPLPQRVSAGTFRDDLYYRIAVFPIDLPLLRERGKDVALLAAHFLKSLCDASSIPRKRLSSEATALLRQHSWPGNVRELQHAMERALILSGGDEAIRPEHLLFDPDLNVIQNS